MKEITKINNSVRSKKYVTNAENIKEKIKKNIENHLLRAEEGIKDGRYRDAEEVFEEWRKLYGI